MTSVCYYMVRQLLMVYGHSLDEMISGRTQQYGFGRDFGCGVNILELYDLFAGAFLWHNMCNDSCVCDIYGIVVGLGMC